MRVEKERMRKKKIQKSMLKSVSKMITGLNIDRKIEGDVENKEDQGEIDEPNKNLKGILKRKRT